MFQSSRAGRPSSARAPSGVSSMPTPSWFPSWAIIAGVTCKPPTTQRYEAGGCAASVCCTTSIVGPMATMNVMFADGSPRWMPGVCPSMR